MSSKSSTSSTISEMDIDMPVRGRGRGRSRSRRGNVSRSRSGSRGSRASGRSASQGRGRSSVRGRGRGRRPETLGARDDRERVRIRREEKTAYMKDVISTLEAEKLRDLVLKLIDREPGMLFDLVEGVEDNGNGGSPAQRNGNPSWCKCGHCREMPTDLERKCCNCLPRNCVSQRDEMDRLVLDPQVLALGSRYFREMLGRNQPMENYNKTMRLTAYRNFTLFRHGRLGAGERRVIPSCCIWRIRDAFPSLTGQYTGFIPGRYV